MSDVIRAKGIINELGRQRLAAHDDAAQYAGEVAVLNARIAELEAELKLLKDPGESDAD